MNPARIASLLCTALLVTACRSDVQLKFPARYSPSAPLPRGLRAGVARIDITPPPGAGLMGYGPEGYAAVGHRQRLYARALALEDKNGERFAFVSLDLNGVSAALHRKVAEHLADTTRSHARIGVDRLLLSATHTHSAPSHYYGFPAFDEFGSDLAGYDTVLVRMLVTRISAAVDTAFRNMRPAKLAWGLDTIWEVTRIRDYPAYARNDPSARAHLHSKFPPPLRLGERAAGVDATLAMLRVDAADGPNGTDVPLGAMSVFAVHGTAIPGDQDLYDADLHGVVSRLIEQSLSPSSPQYAPAAVHLFMNGSEGDTSPDVSDATRCPLPMLIRTPVSRGPMVTRTRTTWQIPSSQSDNAARCLPTAIAEMNRIGTVIAKRALELHHRLADYLRDDILIKREFTTVHMGDKPLGKGLCTPEEGVATVEGAEDGYSRFRANWRLLGDDSLTYPNLPATPGKAEGCQGEKRLFLGPARHVIAGKEPFPLGLEFSLVNVGPIAIATTPMEATTHSAWIIRRTVADVLWGAESSADSAILIGITNGYSHYLATTPEYALQFYEGTGSEYGPTAVQAIANVYRALGAALKRNDTFPAPPDVITGWYDSKQAKGILDWSSASGGASGLRASVHRTDSVTVDWRGEAPVNFYNGRGTSLFFESQVGGRWVSEAWDDLTIVEVRLSRHRDAVDYHAVWRGAFSGNAAHRVRLTTMAGAVCITVGENKQQACAP